MTRCFSLSRVILAGAALVTAVAGLHAQGNPGSGLGATAAYTFDDIAGKWCTAGGSEQFERDSIIAVVASTGERRVFSIVGYEFMDDTIRVTWKDKEKSVHADYGEFSPDRRQMVQLKNTAGPRREFHRC
jgi:hypothetical protein